MTREGDRNAAIPAGLPNCTHPTTSRGRRERCGVDYKDVTCIHSTIGEGVRWGEESKEDVGTQWFAPWEGKHKDVIERDIKALRDEHIGGKGWEGLRIGIHPGQHAVERWQTGEEKHRHAIW